MLVRRPMGHVEEVALRPCEALATGDRGALAAEHIVNRLAIMAVRHTPEPGGGHHHLAGHPGQGRAPRERGGGAEQVPLMWIGLELVRLHGGERSRRVPPRVAEWRRLVRLGRRAGPHVTEQRIRVTYLLQAHRLLPSVLLAELVGQTRVAPIESVEPPHRTRAM